MVLIGSRESKDLPRLQVSWVRGLDNISFRSRPRCALVLGKRGSGKSNLLENMALQHKKIIDLMGSRDNENLIWCRKRSPVDDVLLVTGPNVDVKGSSWDTCKMGDLTLDKMLGYEVVTTADSFFSSQLSRYEAVNMMTELFWDRLEWDYPIGVVIREASNYIYSRIVNQSFNIKEAKADFLVFQREIRHFGFSLLVDTVRWTSIDKEMRDLADLLFIKRVGSQGLPDDLRFLYRWLAPLSVARMKAERFMVITDLASVGIGRSDRVLFHKEEGIDLMKELGLSVEVGEEAPVKPLNAVQNDTHAKMMALIESGVKYTEIARRVSIGSNATVARHLRLHNDAVKERGVCPECDSEESPLARTWLRPKTMKGPAPRHLDDELEAPEASKKAS